MDHGHPAQLSLTLSLCEDAASRVLDAVDEAFEEWTTWHVSKSWGTFG